MNSTHSLMNYFNHVIQFLIRHAWIDANPEGIVHDAVGILKTADNAIAFSFFAHLIEARVLDEVAGEEHTSLDAFALNVRHDFLAGDAFAGQVMRKPNQLGLLFAHGSGRMSLSSMSFRPFLR